MLCVRWILVRVVVLPSSVVVVVAFFYVGVAREIPCTIRMIVF